MSDSKIIVPDELVQEYSRIKNVSLAQARANLEANIRKESEGVDLSQQYKTLIQAFRTMSPQLNGVVMRETDMANDIKSLKGKVTNLEYAIEALNERLDFERDVYKKSMDILNGIVEEDKKTLARIITLENTRLPFYARIWNKIKCLLKI